jgi:hypothetical protein
MADQNIKVKIDLDVTEFNKSVKAMSDALSKVLGKDVEIFNGKINRTKKLVEDTDKALNNATSSINKVGNSLKQTNQQWTNLALVVQDLPYGFRGIQNNLPALLGGFAAVTGPIYLGISAVISAITIWDEKTRQAASAAKKLKEEQASLNDEILESTQSGRQQGILLKAYIDIAKNATLTDNVRNEALKKANELYGEHNEKLTLANINTEKVKKSVDGYIQSLIHMAVAQKYSDQVANNIVKTDKIQAQIDKKKEKSYALLLEYTQKQTLESRDVVDVMYDRRVVELEIAKLETQKAANAQELITLTDKYSKSLIEATRLSAEFGKIEKPKKEKKEKDPKLEAQIQEGKDIMYIADKNTKEFEDIEEKARKQREDNEEKAGKIIISNREDINHALMAINKKFISDDLDIIEANTRNALKANRGRYRAQLDIIKEAGIELQKERQKALELGSDVAPVDKALQQNSDQLNAYADRWKQTADVINNALESMIEGGITQFAQNIGKAFAGEKVDLFDGFLSIISEGFQVIGKALIAYGVAMEAFKKSFTNPYAAIAAGIALVGIGSFIGAKVGQMAAGKDSGNPKKFANGGIISGPTYGLMGEYPGASSNPEVVAPLDKLKDMIGSNNGTLETRISGNDLLILINKANRNNSNTF